MMKNKKPLAPAPGQLHCQRCGENWYPKIPKQFKTPKQCPACKSRYWDSERESSGRSKAVLT